MKVRIISAIIALAICIPLIIIGGIPYVIAMGILSILAYKEILDLKKSHQDIPALVKILGLFSLLYLAVGTFDKNFLTYKAALLPLLLVLLPTVFYKDNYTTKDGFYLLGGIYLIGLLFNILITIRSANVNVLIYLLSVAIITDTFAYLVGCLIGKHKVSKISPKKSWEGVIGGTIAGTIIPVIIYSNLIAPFNFKIILVTIILSLVGQVGDLFYSKIKRENDIKDFSNIMPGHGGILDRLDSISFVVFAYIILLGTV